MLFLYAANIGAQMAEPFSAHAQVNGPVPGYKRADYQLKGPVRTMAMQTWYPPKDTVLYIYASLPDTPALPWELKSKQDLAFDAAARLLSETETTFSGRRKQEQLQQRRYYYDKERLIAAAGMTDGKEADSLTWHYRRNGLADEQKQYRSGRLEQKTVYIYKNGRLFTERKNDADNVPVSLVRYRYKDDRLSETQHFDRQFRLSLIKRYSSQWSADSMLQESYAINDPEGKMISGVSTIRNRSGNITEQSYINAGREVTEYHRLTYDSQGFPIEEKTFVAPVSVTTVNRYRYDEKGNWTRKEVFVNDELQQIVLRSIGYGA